MSEMKDIVVATLYNILVVLMTEIIWCHSSGVINFVILFLESEGGRSKTLHKLRSKTIALFSKDGGYSTLPK